jgi:predicted DNA-binding transcriptional regulator YafY
MYHPTGRVLTVLELLQSRPGLTGPELAERLETDVRTVRRYITKLQDVGIPVEARPGRYGGYILRPGYKLPPLIFSEQEAAAIVLGLLARSWLEVEQSQAAVEGALSKITRVLPQGARDRLQAMSGAMYFSTAHGESKPDASLIMMLTDAIQSERCVRLSYSSVEEAITKRVVEPYGLVGRRGKWYLVGWCRLRADYRTFRLDRIRKATLIEERFAKKKDFDFRAYAVANLESFPVNWRIKVLFEATKTRVRGRINASLGTLSETPEGVLFEWPIDDLDYGARYLMTSGLAFHVVEPPELKDAFLRLSNDARAVAGA